MATTAPPADVTSRVHEDLKDVAVRAAAAAELDVAGVDLVATDISGPAATDSVFVRHVAAGPSLDLHRMAGGDGERAAERIDEHGRIFTPIAGRGRPKPRSQA